MTPEVIILGPDATVAEALAQIRDPDWVVSIAVQVFISQPRTRRRPASRSASSTCSACCASRRTWYSASARSDDPTVAPDSTDREVAEMLASYDLLALSVVDEAGRFLGAVTVDDVIDRMLGEGWRTPPTGRDRRGGRVVKRREDLDAPAPRGRVGVQYDSDTFGAFSESIAKFLGTARFLVWQTIVITVWILLNTLPPTSSSSIRGIAASSCSRSSCRSRRRMRRR